MTAGLTKKILLSFFTSTPDFPVFCHVKPVVFCLIVGTGTLTWEPVQMKQMRVRRSDAGAAYLDGNIYVVGGFNGAVRSVQ
jgi:hypothetical protein